MVKRFMADQEIDRPWRFKKPVEPKNKKVAVIGAGPAGLTAGIRLVEMGYQRDRL